MFRDLMASEIELRVQSVTKSGFILLLYKDARADMMILDEGVGAMGWKREHSRDNANCTVSVWSDKMNQWITKEDTGTESNTEKQKGLASDSFKRACFNWGIGRELYSSPFIWISDKSYIKPYKGKDTVKEKFKVSELEIDNKNIVLLKISDSKGKEVFSYKKPLPIQANQLKRINILITEMGVDTKIKEKKDKTYKWLGITSLKTITSNKADELIEKLLAAKKTKGDKK